MDWLLIGSTLAKIAFVLIILFTFAPILVWAERRQSAMIQDRVGPVRAGVTIFGREIRLLGLLHPLADSIKMVWKEDFVPPNADRLLHAAAPIIALVPALATFAVIPFGNVLYLDHLTEVLPAVPNVTSAVRLQVASVNVGILYIFAIAGTGIVGAAIAGYSSNNKFALLGGLRAAGQMVSYEVTLGLALVGCFMVYGTLLLEGMVSWQMTHHVFGIPLWGIVVQPLAFFLFLFAAIAESKRIPFDAPEGESEIVAGYFLEYSGMKFGMFFMGEFIEVVVSSALVVTLFFGGYHFPFLQATGFELGSNQLLLPHLAVIGLQLSAFIVKLVVVIWLQLMIRWTLPRFRYDQIMKVCWRLILPLSLLNIFATGIIMLFLENQ